MKLEVKNTTNTWFNENHYKNLDIELNNWIPQLECTEEELNDLCKALAGYFDKDHEQNYEVDMTGLWIEFPKDWDEWEESEKTELIMEFKNIVRKHYVEHIIHLAEHKRLPLKIPHYVLPEHISDDDCITFYKEYRTAMKNRRR